MKRTLAIVLALFLGVISAQADLTASTFRQKKKSHQGPRGDRGKQGPKGDPGPRGPAGPIATEYMNLSNPLSSGVLEYDLVPFTFNFSARSPNTKSLRYECVNQDSYVVLQPGKYCVLYELEGFLGFTQPSHSTIGRWPPEVPIYDIGTGWTIELSFTPRDAKASEFSHTKCTMPRMGGGASRGESGEKLSRECTYLAQSMLSVSHSQFIEVPRDFEWLLRLKSIDYPQRCGALPNDGSNGGQEKPYKLFFFGNNSSSASPINLSILKIGEPS